MNYLKIDTSGGDGGNGTDGKAGKDASPAEGADGVLGEKSVARNDTPEDLRQWKLRDRKTMYPQLWEIIDANPELADKDIDGLNYKLATRRGKGTAGGNGEDGGQGGEG